VLPFLLILTNYIKLVNFVYLLKFLLFYIVTFIYSIIYLLLFFFFFTIKNLRFFELHYFNNFMNYGKIYVFFKNKFIYFLF